MAFGRKNRNPKYVYGKENPNWDGPSKAQDNEMSDLITVITADYNEMAKDFSKATDSAAMNNLSGDKEASQGYIELSARIWSAVQEREQLVERLSTDGYTEQWAQDYIAFRERAGLPATRKNNSIGVENDNQLSGLYDEQVFDENQYQETFNVINDVSTDMSNMYGITQQHKDNYADVISGRKTAQQISEEEAPTTEFAAVNPQGQNRHLDSWDTVNPDNIPDSEWDGNSQNNKDNRANTHKVNYPNNNPKSNGSGKGSKTNNATPDSNPHRNNKSNNNNSPENNATRKKTSNSNGSRKKPGLISSFEEKTGLDKNGAFRITYRPTIAGFTFNIGRSGLQSISYRIGHSRSLIGLSYRIWSKDRGTGMSSINLPGGASYRFKDNKKKIREQASSRVQSNNESAQGENIERGGILSRIFGR